MLPLATEVTVLTVELLEVEQVELTAEQQGRVRDMLTEGDVSVEVVEAMLDDILTEGGTVDAAALHNDTLLQLVRAPSDLCSEHATRDPATPQARSPPPERRSMRVEYRRG